MIDNLLGGNDDSEPEADSVDDDMGGGLFDEGEGGDDLMDGGDDLMGGGDMGFDDMDDEGGATSAEMDNRIDELENEVASLSSTVNTVKSENEQISNSLGDVEENIRKLLEIYEMVTRGVNPFVDETEMGDAFGGGGGGASGGDSMSLFGDDEATDESEAAVDDSIADADAEDFFDDDLDDDLDDGFDDDFEDFDDDPDDEGDFDDGFDDLDDADDSFDDFEDGDDLEDDSSGKSFEELKAEYDSGEADWDGGDDGADGSDETTELEERVDEVDDLAVSDPVVDEAEPDMTSAVAADASVPVDGGKPYLNALPSGYVADLVVMDWLEFLVSESGVDGAARTIAYYEAIEWIGEDAAETLQTFLNGFGEGTEIEPEPRSSLTVSHHNTSLRFISRISNPDMEMVAFDERADLQANGRSGTVPADTTAPSRFRPEPNLPNGPLEETYGMESDGGRDLTFDADCFEWGDDRAN